jgi:hypothetical protein
MMRHAGRWLGAVVVLVLMAGTAGADEFKLTPSVSVRQEYNDNIFFDYNSRNAEDSFITRVRPGLELIQRTERLDLQLAGFVIPYLYWSNSDLNAVDQNYSGRVSYLLTPLLRVGAEAAVGVDHTADRDITTTGLTYRDDRRIRQRYAGSADYEFNERTSGSVGYAYSREDWRSESPDLENYDSHAVTLGLNRELGAAKGITVGFVKAGYTYYDYETSTNDYVFGVLGIKHRLSEIFNLSVDAGARYTHSEFDVATGKESNSGWSPIAHAGLGYAGEKTHASLDAFYDVMTSSDQLVQRTALTFSVGHLLTDKLRLGVFTGTFYNKSDDDEFSGTKSEYFTFIVNPSLRWEIWNDVTLEAGYTYTYLNDREGDAAAVGNLGYIQLAYGLPLLE